MKGRERIRARHLERKAVVYVRQSTRQQVQENRESTRLQYQLRERARELGWSAARIEVIDEDLGVSGSGLQERPGFRRMTQEVAQRRVGAVFGLDATRLSRNTADWAPVPSGLAQPPYRHAAPSALGALFRLAPREMPGPTCLHAHHPPTSASARLPGQLLPPDPTSRPVPHPLSLQQPPNRQQFPTDETPSPSTARPATLSQPERTAGPQSESARRPPGIPAGLPQA